MDCYYYWLSKNQMEYSPADKLIMRFDQALGTIFGSPKKSDRAYPAETVASKSSTDESDNAELSQADKELAAGLMRVNHVGEVCAQALYQSQALTARSLAVRESMQQAAAEENDHLAWCEQRLDELGGHKSYLNPLWYAGAFSIGTVAGLAGDKWNLGFVAETERQVVKHLEKHLGELPENDDRSRAIVAQMQEDEAAHAAQAVAAGAAPLPAPIKAVMGAASSVMTATARWI